MQYCRYVCIQQDGLLYDFLGCDRFAQIDAGIDCVWVAVGHLPEGILDDDRRVAAHAQLQERHMPALGTLQELFISLCGGVPAFILHESAVAAQMESAINTSSV